MQEGDLQGSVSSFVNPLGQAYGENLPWPNSYRSLQDYCSRAWCRLEVLLCASLPLTEGGFRLVFVVCAVFATLPLIDVRYRHVRYVLCGPLCVLYVRPSLHRTKNSGLSSERACCMRLCADVYVVWVVGAILPHRAGRLRCLCFMSSMCDFCLLRKADLCMCMCACV